MNIEEVIEYSKITNQHHNFFPHIDGFYAKAKIYFEKFGKRLGFKIKKFPSLVKINSSDFSSSLIDIGGDSFLVYDTGFAHFTHQINKVLIEGDYSSDVVEHFIQTLGLLLSNRGLEKEALFASLTKISFLKSLQEDYQRILKSRIGINGFESLDSIKLAKILNYSCLEPYQEFFIICHELTHYLVKNVFTVEDVNHLVEKFTNPEEVSDLNVLRQWMNIHSENFENLSPLNKVIKEQLNNPSLREEVFCDIYAACITWEYFTDELENPLEVLMGLKLISYSIQVFSLFASFAKSNMGKNDKNWHRSDIYGQSITRSLVLDTFCAQIAPSGVPTGENPLHFIAEFTLMYAPALRNNFKSLLYLITEYFFHTFGYLVSLPNRTIANFKYPIVGAYYFSNFNIKNHSQSEGFYYDDLKRIHSNTDLIFSNLIKETPEIVFFELVHKSHLEKMEEMKKFNMPVDFNEWSKRKTEQNK